MKTLLLVTLFLVCGTVCLAQDPAAEPLSRTVFKLSPQHFTINALKAGVERFNKKPHGQRFDLCDRDDG